MIFMTLTKNNCPVCGSHDFVVLDERVIQEKILRNVLCRKCSHVFVNPHASPEEYDEYYRQGFSKKFNLIEGSPDLVNLAAGNEAKTKRILKFILPYVKPGGRVLEIGAGYGNLLAALRDHYGIVELDGLEPDPLARQVAKKAFTLDLQEVLLDDFKPALDRRYDLIVMHHVLEHFLDPASALQKIKSLLQPAGFIYLGVPNVAAMTFPRNLYFRFPHVQNFSPFSLYLLLLKQGLKVVTSGALTRPLAVIAAPLEASYDMIDWAPVVAKSLPYKKIIKNVKFYHYWHVLRLFIRDKIQPMIPHFIKNQLKRSFKPKAI